MSFVKKENSFNKKAFNLKVNIKGAQNLRKIRYLCEGNRYFLLLDDVMKHWESEMASPNEVLEKQDSVFPTLKILCAFKVNE